jgi:hypothetical protein
MASKRIDELDARVVADADLLPVTPSGGPSGKATVAAVVAEGLSQPNSASSGAGATLSIIAADGVTSGAGGSIILEPGAQATTGGNGSIIVRQPGGAAGKDFSMLHDGTNAVITTNSGAMIFWQGSVRVFATGNGYLQIYQGFNGNTDAARIGASLDLNSTHIRQRAGGIIAIYQGEYGTEGGSFAFASSTTAISTSQNNLALTGSAFQRLNCTSASDITGVAAPSGGAHFSGRMIRLVSVGTATVTLKHNDAASTAANRIYMHGGNHTSLTVNEWADLVYDSTDNGSGAAGWRLVKYA